MVRGVEDNEYRPESRLFIAVSVSSIVHHLPDLDVVINNKHSGLFWIFTFYCKTILEQLHRRGANVLRSSTTVVLTQQKLCSRNRRRRHCIVYVD